MITVFAGKIVNLVDKSETFSVIANDEYETFNLGYFETEADVLNLTQDVEATLTFLENACENSNSLAQHARTYGFNLNGVFIDSDEL